MWRTPGQSIPVWQAGHSGVGVNWSPWGFVLVLTFGYPLLSQLSELTDASWWLLDSGASTSVLAESNLTAFGTQVTSEHMTDRYSAANGSQVRMCGTTDICVHMYMADDSGGRSMWKKAYMKVLVGSIKHNILSVTSLANSGWRFTQGPAGFDLYHAELNLHFMETAYFSNCPWVRMQPSGLLQLVPVTLRLKPNNQVCHCARSRGLRTI